METDTWVCECCGQEGTIVAEADDGQIIEIEEPIADPYTLAKEGKLHPWVKGLPLRAFGESIAVGDIIGMGPDGRWSTSYETGPLAKVILVDHEKDKVWIRTYFGGEENG